MMNRMRRTLVPETWLADLLKNRRAAMWAMQTPQRHQELQMRYQKELEELSADKNKQIKQDENVPR